MSGADAAAADARMDQIEATLASLTKILKKQQHAISPALSLAETALEPGPGLFMQYTTTGGSGTKSVLRPNPPFVFDSDWMQGRAFLHAVRSYARLVPEVFVENRELSEEKVVWYAMSFMAKDAAQRWAERQSAKAEFPFPTWEMFVKEFRLHFVEENEQDHALHKLESHAYHMGNWDVFRHTDEFEDLVDLAGFEDELVKVTKYRTGLDPAINLAITGCLASRITQPGMPRPTGSMRRASALGTPGGPDTTLFYWPVPEQTSPHQASLPHPSRGSLPRPSQLRSPWT